MRSARLPGYRCSQDPRNAAAGSLRVLDLTITASRRLDYLFLFRGPRAGRPQHQTLEQLTKTGFKVNPNWRKCADIEALMGVLQGMGREARFPALRN